LTALIDWVILEEKWGDSMERNLGCALLAAGSARRFGGNKLTALYQGKPLIQRTLEAVPTEEFSKLVAVTQYREVAALAEEFGFLTVENHQPDLGLSHSIHLALEELMDCDGVLFLVSDQPLLKRDSVQDLVRLWRTDPERPAALAHDGVRGNPCIFPKKLFPELLALEGDRGGSAVLKRYSQELLLLEVPAQELLDVDTPQALEHLESLRP
jgi:molybdenum cofactor cytidylyltransferase